MVSSLLPADLFAASEQFERVNDKKVIGEAMRSEEVKEMIATTPCRCRKFNQPAS